MGLLQWLRERNIIRAKSLEEYIALLKKHNCSSVEATGTRESPSGPMFSSETSATVGNIGDFVHWNRFTAQTSESKPIVFDEMYGEQATYFGSTRGFSDAAGRNVMIMRTLLTAEQTLKKIQNSIPGIHVSIAKLGEAAVDKLHTDAQRRQVTPFLETA